jgi:hypothetical protein
MDPSAGLDAMENGTFSILTGLYIRPLGRPARSQSLYRLSYPGSINCSTRAKIKYTAQITTNIK